MNGSWYRSEYTSDTTRAIYHLRGDGTEEYVGEVRRFEVFKPVDPTLEMTPAMRKILGSSTLVDKDPFMSNERRVY